MVNNYNGIASYAVELLEDEEGCRLRHGHDAPRAGLHLAELREEEPKVVERVLLVR